MRTHIIKVLPCYHEATLNGTKPFDIRFNDRNYQRGDKVIMHVHDRVAYLNIYADIGDVINFQQKEGWVVFGLLNIRTKETE